jgi:hypothetical protein
MAALMHINAMNATFIADTCCRSPLPLSIRLGDKPWHG